MSPPGPASSTGLSADGHLMATEHVNSSGSAHRGMKCSKARDDESLGRWGGDKAVLWLSGCGWGQWILRGSGGDTWNKHAL